MDPRLRKVALALQAKGLIREGPRYLYSLAIQELITELQGSIIAEIKGRGRVTESELAKAMLAVRRISAEGARAFIPSMDEIALDVLAQLLDKQSTAFKILGVRKLVSLQPRAAAEAYLTFEAQIADRTVLTSIEPYRQLWWDEWGDRWNAIGRALQRRMTRGILTGEALNDIAADLAPSFAILGLGRGMDADAWTRAFVRTKATELQVAAAIRNGLLAWGEDARFLNVGIPDASQSQVCFEASNAGALTLDEWEEWESSTGEGGPPPRHVFNCRCTMLALSLAMIEALGLSLEQDSPIWEMVEGAAVEREAA